jgi:hypothetical protein
MSDITEVDKSDRAGLYLSVAFAAIGIVGMVANTIQRLIEVAPGKDIPVLVPLNGESAQLPLGPNGEAFTAQVDTATVLVADPAPATLFALWAQPIVIGLSWSVGLVLAAMFCLRLARGQAFGKTTARIVYAAASVLIFGWFAGSILTNMSTNGAMSAISDYTYDSVVFTASFGPMFAALLIAAVGVALQVGEKLERETDGLV